MKIDSKSEKKRGRKGLIAENNQRQKAEKWILGQLTVEPKRWNELWNNRNDVISSREYLSRLLRYLEERQIIKKIVNSHKNIQYILSKDFELLSKSLDNNKESQENHFKLMIEIEKVSLQNISSNQLCSSIALNIFQKMLTLLNGIETYARTDKKFKEHASEMILVLINRLGELMVKFGKRFPDETDDAIVLLVYLIFGDMLSLQKILDPKQKILTTEEMDETLQRGKVVVQKIGFRAVPS